MNNLTETGNTFRANGSLVLSGPGTALTVNNAATFGTVNTATVQANTIITTFVTANGISVMGNANNAYNQANTANTIAVQSGDIANSAFAAANVANTIAVQSGTVGNSAFSAANVANAIAVQSGTIGNSAFSAANTGNTRAFGAFAQANSAWTTANTANTIAVQSGTIGNSAFAKANAAYTQANTPPGSDQQLIFNNGGSYGANGRMTINLTSNTVTFSTNVGVGDLTIAGTMTTISDARIKTNIEGIDSGLTIVRQLQPVQYNLFDGPAKSYGFIAQDIEKILPDIIKDNGDLKTLGYINLIAFLAKAVKELDEKVTRLENERI
jgi:hypothetical protein